MSCCYSESLLFKIQEQNNQNQVDIERIKKGISFAKYYHGSQMRKSGEPYYSHPIAVASMVTDYMFRENPIIGALLHDTLEDTTLTLSEIEYEFNPRIAQIVDRLTRKIDPVTGKKMSAGECLIQSFLLKDDDVTLIKMIDRLHNISTINFMSKEKQKKIIDETLRDFYIISSLKEYNLFLPNIVTSEGDNFLF
jgi:(p)ppGpp synthase/HD superfamily hydrolase